MRIRESIKLRAVLRGARIGAASSIFLFCGCSLVSNPEPPAHPDVVLETSENLPGNERMPFALQVNQEINDGKELHILGNVKANTAWNPDYVIVRLTSLKDGNPVGVVHQSLRKLIEAKVGLVKEVAAVVDKDEEVSFSLTVPSVGISDYQIVLLWGEEAEPYLDKGLPRMSGKSGGPSVGAGLKLRVHSIEIETLRAACSYPPCDVRFRLKALLQNEGKATIKSAKLGVGFIPSELASAQTVPEQEETVDVPNLNLEPGNSRPFRILLNQEMSEEVSESVHPVLRIISFE